MNTDKLQQAIDLLQSIVDESNKPWYPDDRNWVEWDGQQNFNFPKHTKYEVLRRDERTCKKYYQVIYDNRYCYNPQNDMWIKESKNDLDIVAYLIVESPPQPTYRTPTQQDVLNSGGKLPCEVRCGSCSNSLWYKDTLIHVAEDSDHPFIVLDEDSLRPDYYKECRIPNV